MRKTNFLLSFKREDKFFPSITRNITVISEEEEPPASFCKGSKLANPIKDKKSHTGVIIRKNPTSINKEKLLQLQKKYGDNVSLGTAKGLPVSSNQDAFSSKDPIQKLKESFRMMNPDPDKPPMTKIMSEQ